MTTTARRGGILRKYDPSLIGLRRWPQIIALVIATISVGLSQTPEAHLDGYRARVSFTSARDATVRATLSVTPHTALKKLLIARYPDQQVAHFTARQSQSPVPFTAEKLAGALVIHVSHDGQGTASSALEIQYSIHAPERLRRVPLPVIDLPPWPQQRPVAVEANLPDGMTVIGDTFPPLTWRDAKHGEVWLAAVPSLLVVETNMAVSASRLDRWLTPAALSTIAMLGLLLAGSILWWARKRSAARQARSR